MAHSVCPWWIGYFLLSPVRRLGQDPRKVLGPYVEPGMTVLDVGCAMGFFTLDAARLVGETGRVVAVDLQPRMLHALERRGRRAGLDRRIETRPCSADDLGVRDLEGEAGFVLAFAVAHEVPSQERFLAQLEAVLRPDGRLLLAEPVGHVTPGEFADTLAAAARAGLRVVERPDIRRSRAAVLAKKSSQFSVFGS